MKKIIILIFFSILFSQDVPDVIDGLAWDMPMQKVMEKYRYVENSDGSPIIWNLKNTQNIYIKYNQEKLTNCEVLCGFQYSELRRIEIHFLMRQPEGSFKNILEVLKKNMKLKEMIFYKNSEREYCMKTESDDSYLTLVFHDKVTDLKNIDEMPLKRIIIENKTYYPK